MERTDDIPERFGGTHRFRVAASLAGRPFETFVLDVGHADGAVGVEILTTPDLLGFAGIAPVAVPTIPVAVQVAEKLHAYTRLYEGGRVGSRAKDLVDLALFAQMFTFDAAELQRTVDTVFAARATHEPPRYLRPPPDQWNVPFRQLALAVGLDGDLGTGHGAAAAMLDPILDHRFSNGTWDPETRYWSDRVTR